MGNIGLTELKKAFKDSGKDLKEFLRLIKDDDAKESEKRDFFYDLMKSDYSKDKPNFVERRVKNVFDAIKTQEDSGIPTITDQIIKFSNAEKLLFDNNNKLLSFKEIWENIKSGAEGFIENQALLYLKERNGLLEEINTKTSLTGKLSKDYRDELQKATGPLVLIGVGLDEIVNASINLISITGKFKLLNQETWVESAKVAKAYVGSIEEVVNSIVAFEKVGYGANDTNKILETVAKNSIGVGIESRRVTKDLQTNIGKLNEYGFKNGVQGLGEMIKKSIEFRTNIQSTFDVADKLLDFNSALEMSAKLQALGGAIGNFNNPSKMVNLAMNDVEGLQDSIIDLTKDLVAFNSEQGKFEISGYNRLIAKDQAQALGIKYEDFASMAIAAQERIMAKTDLMGAKLGKDFIDDNLKEFLINMAQMDGGELKIAISSDLKEEFKNFKELDKKNMISLKDISKNEKLLEKLQLYQNEIKGMSKEDIIKNQASSVKNIERYVSFLVATARIKGGQAIGNLADAFGIKLVDQIKEVSTNFTKSKYGPMFSDEIVKTIGKASGMNSKEIREILNGETLFKEKDAKDKKQKEAEAKQQQVIKHEVTFVVKNDGTSTMEAISREIGKSPSFTKAFREKIESVYTNNNNVVTN
jgi:hypothetical protein